MPIKKGSTPTIRIVLSADEVAYNTITKVLVAFAQKENVISGLTTTFTPDPTDPDEYDASTGIITFKKKLTQAETLALLEDVDLDCEVNVLTTNSDRKISKTFSFGICKSLYNQTLS